MKRIEDFPIDEKVVDEFISENKKKWKTIKHNGKYIFLNFSMVRMQCGWIIPKILYAKGIEETSGAQPLVFTWNENALLTRFFESYGIQHISYHTVMKKDISSLFKSLWKTFCFMITDGTGDGLKNMYYLGVNVGKPLYEDILRTSPLSTIRSARNSICVKKIVHLLWLAGTFDKLCKKYPIEYGVSDDIAYHEGMLIKIMHQYTNNLFVSNNYRQRKIEIKNDTVERQGQYLNKQCKEKIHLVSDEQAQWSLQHLKERFQGKNGRVIDRGAFLDKQIYTKKDMKEMIGIDNSKKNVVIMAHTFTDAVFSYGDTFCRDYYDWVEMTLRIASQNEAVNWILKPHPTRFAYNESVDSIELLFEKYKKENMFLLPDEVGGESIKYIADVIITIGGNAGAEYACFGIPVVIIGKPYYSGFGYTIEPTTKEEYKKVLLSIQEKELLDDEQKKIAQKVFYLANSKNLELDKSPYRDIYAHLSNTQYEKMFKKAPLDYFKDNKGTQNYNSEYLKQISCIFPFDKIEQIEYFMRGKKI